jgi:hypothetical protein
VCVEGERPTRNCLLGLSLRPEGAYRLKTAVTCSVFTVLEMRIFFDPFGEYLVEAMERVKLAIRN